MNRPFQVLIADDEKPVAAGLQAQLESLGYEVVALVSDGHHAIEVCRRLLPDVVIMDIEMPGLDGLSAARQIVRDPGTPVVILTAHGHANLIDQAVFFAGVVGRDRCIFFPDISFAQVVEAEVGDDPINPGIERTLKAEASEVFISLKKGVLMDILGIGLRAG